VTAEKELFTTAEPQLLTLADENGSVWFQFGYMCGEKFCMIPLQADDVRCDYWQAPICNSAADAQRMWFLVYKLMEELGS